MVVLNRIYTRTGDRGTTALGTGERRPKHDLRIAAYGTVDETNAAIGLARLATRPPDGDGRVDAMLLRIQNDLFDLGADLCTPPCDGEPPGAALRIVEVQVVRLEREIDELNAELEPLRSFVLPGGSTAAAFLHQA
jgi:cob(I)alamin adenosyltransferase